MVNMAYLVALVVLLLVLDDIRSTRRVRPVVKPLPLSCRKRGVK